MLQENRHQQDQLTVGLPSDPLFAEVEETAYALYNIAVFFTILYHVVGVVFF